MGEKKITVTEFIKNQEEYCEKHDVPFFMPDNDRCWSCKGHFITELIKDGLTGKEKLITGCPICNYSFVS